MNADAASRNSTSVRPPKMGERRTLPEAGAGGDRSYGGVDGAGIDASDGRRTPPFRATVLPSTAQEASMRKTAKSGGLTVRAIAGSNNVLIGIDLDPAKRAGWLGFTLQRADVGTPALRFLPNSSTSASTAEATVLDTAH